MKQEEAYKAVGVKSTNPKDLQGIKKIPFHIVPMTSIAVTAVQMLDGCGKYGRENFRDEKVKASVYYDAALRHLVAWFSGEDNQEDNGLHHLGGVMASCAILIDAIANDQLIDDRAYTNNYTQLIAKLNKEVERILEKHKDKSPKHFSHLVLTEPEQELMKKIHVTASLPDLETVRFTHREGGQWMAWLECHPSELVHELNRRVLNCDLGLDNIVFAGTIIHSVKVIYKNGTFDYWDSRTGWSDTGALKV